MSDFSLPYHFLALTVEGWRPKSNYSIILPVFTENHDVNVITLLFYHLRYPDYQLADGEDFAPFTVTWADAAQAFRSALTIDLNQLPSRCEIFYIFADLPHQKFSNEKAKRILGWQPTNQLEQLWRKVRI